MKEKYTADKLLKLINDNIGPMLEELQTKKNELERARFAKENILAEREEIKKTIMELDAASIRALVKARVDESRQINDEIQRLKAQMASLEADYQYGIRLLKDEINTLEKSLGNKVVRVLGPVRDEVRDQILKKLTEALKIYHTWREALQGLRTNHGVPIPNHALSPHVTSRDLKVKTGLRLDVDDVVH